MTRDAASRPASEQAQAQALARVAVGPLQPRLSYMQPTVIEDDEAYGSAVSMATAVLRCPSHETLAEYFADLMLFPPTAVRIAAQWARRLPNTNLSAEAHLRATLEVLLTGQTVLEAKAVEGTGGHALTLYPFGMDAPHLAVQANDPALPPLFLATVCRMVTTSAHTLSTSSFRVVRSTVATVKYSDYAYNRVLSARLRRTVLLAAFLYVHCQGSQAPGPMTDQFPELGAETRLVFYRVLSQMRDRVAQEETIAAEKRCRPLDPWRRHDLLLDLKLLIDACSSKRAFQPAAVFEVLATIIARSAEAVAPPAPSDDEDGEPRN